MITASSLLVFAAAGTIGDRFGCALAAGVDCDGDGVPDVVIGDGDWGGGTDVVWIVSGRDHRVIRRLESPPNERGFGEFGGLVENADGNGHAGIATCTLSADERGFLRVIRAENGTPIWTRSEAELDGARLGSVAVIGDVD